MGPPATPARGRAVNPETAGGRGKRDLHPRLLYRVAQPPGRARVLDTSAATPAASATMHLLDGATAEWRADDPLAAEEPPGAAPPPAADGP